MELKKQTKKPYVFSKMLSGGKKVSQESVTIGWPPKNLEFEFTYQYGPANPNTRE